MPVAGPICPCAPFSGLWQRNPGVLTFGPVEGHTSILLSAAVRPGWDLRPWDSVHSGAYIRPRWGQGSSFLRKSLMTSPCARVRRRSRPGVDKPVSWRSGPQRGAHAVSSPSVVTVRPPLGPTDSEAARPAAAYLVTSMLLFIIWVRLRVASGFDDASAD